MGICIQSTAVLKIVAPSSLKSEEGQNAFTRESFYSKSNFAACRKRPLPFSATTLTSTFLHWPPLDLQFHQKAAVLTTDASRKNFCLRHLAVVAKSATNAQVTMSRNLNFSETTQCLTINPKVSFSFLSIVWKSWKFWCQNVKVDKDRKEKKKLERLRAQAFNFVRLLLYF